VVPFSSHMRRVLVIVPAVVFLGVLGCKKSAPPAASNQAVIPAAAQGNVIQGTLLERLDVPNYSYLHIQASDQQVWAAVPTSTIEKGSAVTVVNPMPMRAFESTALKRTFDVVYFGTLGQAAPAANPAAHHMLQPSVEMGDLKIEKARGSEARTISELYAQKDALKEKPVLIRGKVVKYNVGILGRNWIHLRDGSGSDAGENNDIAITTQDVTTLGEVVTARGTVHLNKDFGTGYSYPVILENTKLTK